MMFWKKGEKDTDDDLIPVPDELPPLAGLEGGEALTLERGPRAWLWTLLAAWAIVLLACYVTALGVKGFYDGLRDRAIVNRRIAQEHYALGLEHLAAEEYELAVAEFELALRHNANLREARTRLREAKDLLKAQVTPTSETRRGAAELLYKQAVARYEDGKLAEAVALLDELRGLDADYQRENVALMWTTSHYQLGLNAVQLERLEEAADHFEAVLALDPDDEKAQAQLNLVHLYTAALNHWERDWSATIQALKGLYALAPDYKDVQSRLRDAYVYRALAYTEEGDWCRAAEEYAAAVEVLPLEETVDKRDDAAIRCETAAASPTPALVASGGTAGPTPASRATARPTAQATAQARPTPTPVTQEIALGQGRIAFTSFDAARQRYDIYIVDLSQGDARLLRENSRQPALAPGGKRLAFRNLDPLYLGLGLLDLRSNEVSELTAHVEDSTPVWSPDTAQIVFASNKEGDRKWRIYVISPGEVRGEGEEWAFGQMPTWSPDGSQVAYHGCDERGDNCGVWVMKAGGFGPARLTTDPSDTAPAWSPDGGQIAYVSARDGNWELYLMNMATSQQKRLTNHLAADVAPAWSPDGRRLAFLSNREGVWAVYVLEVKSGRVQKVIATGDAYPEPVQERLSWGP